MSDLNSVNDSPFVQTTTPAIERANRLISLRAHPGFLDLLRLSQEMIQEAFDAAADYPGWDTEQMIVLHARMKAAKEHHFALLNRIQAAIDAGKADAEKEQPTKTPAELIEQGDYIRQQVLQKFDDADSRLPGSY